MRLQLENGFEGEVTSVSAITAALQSLDTHSNTFAVLSNGDERFIQTARENDGFIVERRDGNFRAHFCAARPGGVGKLKKQSFLMPRADLGQDRFSLEEVTDLFAGYWSGTSPATMVDWRKMEMADPGSTRTMAAAMARVVIWTIAILAFLGLLARLIWRLFS